MDTACVDATCNFKDTQQRISSWIKTLITLDIKINLEEDKYIV